MRRPKLLRVSTVPQSLNVLLKGQFRFMANHFDIIGVSSPGGALDELSLREGVRVIPAKIERRIRPLSDLRSLLILYLIFRREKPDIVHSITPKAGLLSMIAARFASVPIRLHTFTGLVFPSRRGLYQAILIWMDRLLCYCATAVYPEGEGVKTDMLRYRITKKPLKILANGNVNGINTDYYNPTGIDSEEKLRIVSSLNIKNTDFVFVFIGRLVSEKGIAELIEAFALLAASRSNVRLLLVGEMEPAIDPLPSALIKVIQDHGAINFLGYKSDIRPYLAVSHALVLPSYREGFPNVVLQAGAMGLPCIVSDVNGSNEIIKNEINGIVIPVRSAGALHAAMMRMLDDISFYAEARLKSRSLIESRFAQSAVWKAHLDEYQRFAVLARIPHD